jgi:NAD(P)-dependent dehydrogenase (short-subunit alcohol dehydrogenase family)
MRRPPCLEVWTFRHLWSPELAKEGTVQELQGKVVLVTGASTGIGLASARALAEHGAVIVGVARGESRLNDAMASLPGSGHRGVVADATVWSQMEPLIAIGRERGGFAGGVFCAGQFEMRPLSLVDGDALHRVFDASVTGTINATKIVAKAPTKSGAGLVWLSSVASGRATPGFVAYAAAKGALEGALKVAALELSSRKIRVNAIVAGVVQSDMSEQWLGKLTPEQRASVTSQHLLGVGSPDDIARVARFLVSDEARWMTGSTVVVDGGLSVR